VRRATLAAVPRKQLVVDVAIVVAVLWLSIGMLARDEADHAARGLDALGVALAALSALPLLARRRAPLAVFAVTAGASVVLSALGYPPGPPIGATVALFQVALSHDGTRARTRLTAATVVGIFAVHLAAGGLQRGELPVVPALLGVLVWGGAWVLGDRVRLRRERVAGLEERAQRAAREAERERRLAAAEERTRIARDLHDSAGHAINVILVQAGAARLLAERDPDRSREALETIEEVARETVAEIDHLVRALREDGSSGTAGPEVEWPPGLAALDALVERHRAAGLAVRVRTRGAGRPLAPAVDQAAYRILREALTNAARHGDGRAEVDVAYGADALEIEVANAIAADRPPGGRHGIVGMRERAALLGGSLETGVADDVFRIRARLPYGGSEP
jgi:signal transduction histidine kinase